LPRSALSALVLAPLLACNTVQEPDPFGGGEELPPPVIEAPADMPPIPALAPRADATCSNGRKVIVYAGVDGDTVSLTTRHASGKNSGNYERVRLLDVDAPETHDRSAGSLLSRPDCFGPEAAAYTAAVLEGQLVCLTWDPAVTRQSDDQDPYGRWLAYVWFGDRFERFLNAELLWRGYARTLIITKKTVFEPYLSSLEAKAGAAPVGLWKECE
jgi:endonuclease YncB( thermonuclease family)